MNPIQMRMVGATGCKRFLAGRVLQTIPSETVVVLIKDSDTEFRLVPVDTSDADQIASFVDADTAETGSLVDAILQATQPPKRKRARRKKAKP